MQELHKSSLPLNESLYQPLSWIGLEQPALVKDILAHPGGCSRWSLKVFSNPNQSMILDSIQCFVIRDWNNASSPMARMKPEGLRDLLTLLDGDGRLGARQRALSPQKRSKTACSVSSVCWMAVCIPAKYGQGSAGLRGKGFRAGSRARSAALCSLPPLAPFPVEVREGINTQRSGAAPTPQEEINIFSSYMILVCSYVTRYLMTVKYCIVLSLKMHTSLEDHSHFSKCFLNATFTNTFIFLLLLTRSLTF